AVPNNARARKVLGATLIRRNEPARAIDILKPLLDQTPDDTQFLMLLGSAYMQTGKVAEGTALYEKAAEISPDVASIRTQLALSRLATGQADRAVSDLESAVDLEPQGSQAGILLALVKLRKGDFDGALKSAEELREKLKDNPLPENLIGAAYLGKGDVARARKTFEDALKVRPDFHPARMNLAQIEVQEGRIDAAKAHYDAILRQSEKHIGAMMALADIAVRQRRNDESVSWLQKAVDADPKSVMPRLRLIGHYSRLGDMQRAVTVARQLDQTFPNNIRVVETLGRTEAAAGDGVASVATFRRLTSLAPNSAAALGLLAGSQILINDLSGARESLQNAISLEPKFGPAYAALVDIELREGREVPALRAATQLREAQPDSAAGDMLAGDIYLRSKKFNEAIQSYKVALRKENTNLLAIRLFNAQRDSGAAEEAFATLQRWVDAKNDRQARHVLASAYIAAGRNDDGVRESERLLANEPDNPLLLNNLAWLYQLKGDGRAQDYGEKALAKAPEAPAIMDTLGWILVQKGDTARGLELLKKAVSLAPDQGDIRYHYAVAMHKSGDTGGARAELNRLLNSGVRFSHAEEARKLLSQ
ncbi:MAG: PEP-CTERM system TPR-repeat protein PrsT, partial [Alphaproteobacteria bacterium]|nr:PEP-CTERM system TPR-repeat protein PrsT [Alphaproteobacteria bacterium]